MRPSVVSASKSGALSPMRTDITRFLSGPYWGRDVLMPKGYQPRPCHLRVCKAKPFCVLRDGGNTPFQGPGFRRNGNGNRDRDRRALENPRDEAVRQGILICPHYHQGCGGETEREKLAGPGHAGSDEDAEKQGRIGGQVEGVPVEVTRNRIHVPLRACRGYDRGSSHTRPAAALR